MPRALPAHFTMGTDGTGSTGEAENNCLRRELVLKRPLTRWLARRTFANAHVCAIAALLRCYPIGKFLYPSSRPSLGVGCHLSAWALDLPAPRVAVTLRSHPQLTATRLANFTRALIDFQTATQTCILLPPADSRFSDRQRFSPSCRVQTRFFVWKIQEP